MRSVRALAPTIIGRQAQIRELEEHLDQARTGAGQLAFIVGDAGVGKTRLLREFASRVQADGVTLLEGHCYDEQPAAPYGPFVDALQALVRMRGPDSVAQAAGAWAIGLAPLLPELELPPSAPHPTDDPQSEKRRLFEAIARVFRAIAQRGLVLILEDLHWSDQSSQELLAYLARSVERDPILILASYRGDELHRRHPLTHLVAQLTRERRYHEVRLPALSRDELARMLEATLERALPHALMDALYERTEGNPFFVEEILKALIENARLDALIAAARRGHHSAQLDIPLSLKESILSRTADLDATTAEVLRYAAVIGRRFDFELLLRLMSLDEAELLRAVERLVERQLVVEERGDAEDRFNFRHALTREAIYDDMLGRERRMKHRAVLQALDELYPEHRDHVVDQLAYHSLQAKELPRAAQYAGLAGDKAMQMHAYREALVHYETALELLETDDPREKAELFDKLTEAAWPLGDTNLPARYMQEAQRLYAQLGDRRKVGEISYWLGFLTWEQGETEAAFAHTRAALTVLEAEPPSNQLAMAYGMLSRLFMLTSRPHDSIVWGEKALQLAEALGDDDVRANVLNNIGCSLVLLGEIQRGIDSLERSLELAKRVGAGTFTTGRAYINLGTRLNDLGEFKRAAGVARAGIAFQNQLCSIPDKEWHVLGSAELELGQWDQAHELLDRAIRAGELGTRAARLQALPSKAELLLRQGRLDEARRLESALSECEKLDDATIFGSFASALARVRLALGDLDQAVVVMDRGVAACWELRLDT